MSTKLKRFATSLAPSSGLLEEVILPEASPRPEDSATEATTDAHLVTAPSPEYCKDRDRGDRTGQF